jgi:hypothetical protein
MRKYRAMKTCYVSVSQIVVRGGPQAISEEKSIAKIIWHLTNVKYTYTFLC